MYEFKNELTMSKSGFLFDHSSGQTYTLNPTGKLIFEKMQEGLDDEAILSTLIEEFEVEAHIARRDLEDFIRQLKEMGVI
ncbi:MAG TPA: HPr-rel-A system PqqD family peptide chaperone [Candidatus Marinimicrobia bacterium]|nr:HPr-rel-A system PqqD family peptide chaperone [Candidatus Neomarinimicrobiota bacterium]